MGKGDLRPARGQGISVFDKCSEAGCGGAGILSTGENSTVKQFAITLAGVLVGLILFLIVGPMILVTIIAASADGPRGNRRRWFW